MSARSLNKVQLIGNLTREPECRYTPNQTQVCSFGIATNREWTNDSGEKQSSVEYHNLVVWSKLAEICKNLLHKGNKVYAEGRLQTREWQAKDGQNRRTTEIIVENMILLNSKGMMSESDGQYGSAPVSENPMSTQSAQEVDPVIDDTDDIPF